MRHGQRALLAGRFPSFLVYVLTRVFGIGRRPFDLLSEQEILRLAISSEEDDALIYRAHADALRSDFPESAKVSSKCPERKTVIETL